MSCSTSHSFAVRAWLVGAMVTLLLALASWPAAGQGTGATIIGRVSDTSGATLPGVTVTATSPALQVPQVTTVTNELGEYRLAPLPVGLFQITFELSGFQTAQSRDVRLTVGFTAQVNVTLNVATLTETVTVSGAAPVVDIASSSAGTLLTKEVLELTPSPRNGIISLLAMAPGVRTTVQIGGGGMTDNPSGRVFGQVTQPAYVIEGLFAHTRRAGGGNGIFWDFQTFDEAQIQTIGSDAEAATAGVQVNTVVKSGGNTFHGGGTWTQTNHNFQSDNLDDKLLAQNITQGNKLNTRWDVGGDLGGRIVLNKLWFYGAARRQFQSYQVLNAFKPDGSPFAETARHTFYTGKLSYQITPSNRVIFYGNRFLRVEEKGVTDLIAYSAREAPHSGTDMFKGEWESVHGSSFVTSLQYRFRKYRALDSINTDGIPGWEDITTQKQGGESFSAGFDSKEFRPVHLRGAATLYKANWLHGNHELKAGGDFIHDDQGRQPGARKDQYRLYFDNGAAYQLAVWNAPVKPITKADYLALFARDSWRASSRLTLNLGLRFARDHGWVPNQCRDAAPAPANLAFPAQCFDRVDGQIWNSLAPRLHFAYDLSGDGKTLIKGGWGRFDNPHYLNGDLQRLGRLINAAAFYTWRDLNGNKDYDVGEVNLNPNGPDFVETRAQISGQAFSNFQATWSVNPDGEKQTKMDEFAITLERELPANVALRVTGVHTRYKNILRPVNSLRPYASYNVPITRPDPGPDGTVGNSDDPGTSLTYFEFPIELAGASFEKFWLANDPKAAQTYNSVELSAMKRLSNRWHLMSSYSATKLHRPFGASSNNVEGAILNPNNEINTDDNTWEWLAKVGGSYVLPADISTSATFEHRSGTLTARTVLLRGGRTIPSLVVNAEPYGSIRLPHINNLNLRVEKIVRWSTQRATVRFDIYNMLNANTVTSIQPRSGAQFMLPRAILSPRVAEASLTYAF